MKNALKKSFLALLVVLFCSVGFNNSAYAASVGQKLTAPESGWQRYDSIHQNIKYSENWGNHSVATYYQGSIRATTTPGSTASFKFEGSKLRIISDSTDDGTHSDKIEVKIDGNVEYFSVWRRLGHQYLVYEKTGLTPGVHEVVITSLDSRNATLDAFDIDGTILPIEEQQPPQEEQPPQEQPPQEQPSNERAILTVTLTTGLEKEFDLSKQEVDDFINWYSQKGQGVGLNQYAISKHDNNKGPFKNRKTYIIFDKVLTFEVDEYTPDDDN
ncbi:bacterial surface protein [Saccharibacillus sacchari]|uniref:Bacterial surface protein n=1 Tax=Saccharibacillus sacchari TaxID=456493 RepID=A0ACC6PFU8_9BACL